MKDEQGQRKGHIPFYLHKHRWKIRLGFCSLRPECLLPLLFKSSGNFAKMPSSPLNGQRRGTSKNKTEKNGKRKKLNSQQIRYALSIQQELQSEMNFFF